MILLPISREYNDISSNTLMILIRAPPIHLVVQYEYQRVHYTYLKTRSEIRFHFGKNHFMERSCPLTSPNTVSECSHAFINISLKSFSCSNFLIVIWDWSRTKPGVMSTFCNMKRQCFCHLMGLQPG